MTPTRKGSPEFGPIAEPSVTLVPGTFRTVAQLDVDEPAVILDPPTVDGLPLAEAMERASRRLSPHRRAIAAQLLAAMVHGVTVPMLPDYRTMMVAEAVRLADSLLEALE